jgi:hypothetical protein
MIRLVIQQEQERFEIVMITYQHTLILIIFHFYFAKITFVPLQTG